MSEQNSVKSVVKISASEEAEVPLHFVMSNFLPSVLAQHITIQGTAENILVGFYEANPPIMFDPNQEAIDALKREGFVAECVARIAIPKSQFIEIAAVFSQVANRLKPTEKEGGDQNANVQ